LRVEAQTHVVSEIARLRRSIGREAAAVHKTLNDPSSASDDESPRWRWQHKELSRQLDALREHVARAPSRSQDHWELRADFATLLSFAKTLRTDAETWRTGFEDELEELARKETAAREEQERLAAERERLLRRREALQSTIHETAGRIAQQNGGDCRNTLPVFRFGKALTVCSVVVLSPRIWFRPDPDWLVTLNDSRDRVRVRRSY
jgi:chromosome segregation ATPase